MSKNSIDGKKEAAQILAGLDPQHRERLLQNISTQNPELAAELKKTMFQFEQVLNVNSDELFEILKHIKTDTLALSLRGLEEKQLNSFLNLITKRQGDAIRELMQLQGPKKLSDVKVARDSILATAVRLHEKGLIHLKR